MQTQTLRRHTLPTLPTALELIQHRDKRAALLLRRQRHHQTLPHSAVAEHDYRGAARARALGATALDHKVADYAVKCETVIESFQPQIDEIGSGYWRRLGMQVDINCALRSRERGSYVGHGYLSRLFAKGAP